MEDAFRDHSPRGSGRTHRRPPARGRGIPGAGGRRRPRPAARLRTRLPALDRRPGQLLGRPGRRLPLGAEVGAGIGWIVGHSFIVYAPLCAGATTLFREGAIDYPDPGVAWEIVERYGVTKMFT